MKLRSGSCSLQPQEPAVAGRPRKKLQDSWMKQTLLVHWASRLHCLPKTSPLVKRSNEPSQAGQAGSLAGVGCAFSGGDLTWSDAEVKLLGCAPGSEIARTIGRSVGAVRTRRRLLRSRDPGSKIRPWTKAELCQPGQERDGVVAKGAVRRKASKTGHRILVCSFHLCRR